MESANVKLALKMSNSVSISLNSLLVIAAMQILIGICYAGELTECDFVQEANRSYEKHYANHVRPANNYFFKIAGEMQSILVSYEWDESSPIDKQAVPSRQIVRFAELEADDEENRLVRLVETRRARDIVFLRDAATLVEKWFDPEFRSLEPVSDEEQITANILHSMWRSFTSAEQELIDYVPDIECSLAEALKSKASAIYSDTRQTHAYVDAIPIYELLVSKYGSPAEFSDISDDERALYVETKNTVEKMFSEIKHASDLYWLAMLEELSIDVNKSYRKDLESDEADTDSLGATWRAWVAEDRYTPQQVELVKYLGILDEHFPTDYMKGIPVRSE